MQYFITTALKKIEKKIVMSQFYKLHYILYIEINYIHGIKAHFVMHLCTIYTKLKKGKKLKDTY